MGNALSTIAELLGVEVNNLGFILALIVILIGFIALLFYWLIEVERKPSFSRFDKNPLLRPIAEHWWESEAVFNPAALVIGGRVNLLYRALGRDGISRIGYASSKDGIHFDERLSEPVYTAESPEEARDHYSFTSPARLVYSRALYASGGGWGGCEDPRAVCIDGVVYMTFNMFNGWDSMRVAFTSIDEYNLLHAHGLWNRFSYLSKPGERQKNWVLFPEKIDGKFALFYNLDKGDPTRVHIAYLDTLTMAQVPSQEEAIDPQQLPDHSVAWHYRTRSAAAPPLKTPYGWLLFYHATDPKQPDIGYKLGALLLDLHDPKRVLYRAQEPVLEPKEWYENEWKRGVTYVSGAVILGDEVIVYYGGGDKYVAAAKANLRDFLHRLMNHEHATLETVKV